MKRALAPAGTPDVASGRGCGGGAWQVAIASVLCGLSMCASAESATTGPSLADALRVLTGLTLVVGLIILSAWLARRSGRLPNATHRRMQLVETLSLGQRERLMLVHVDGAPLLIAVAAGQIQSIEPPRPTTAGRNEDATVISVREVG